MLQISGVSAERLKDGRTAIDLGRRARPDKAFPKTMSDKEVWVAYFKEHMQNKIVNTEAQMAGALATANSIKAGRADMENKPI